MYESISNIYSQGEYKGIPYMIVFEGDFNWTLIAEGREVTNSTSPRRVRDKFQALVDTGYFDD